MSTGEGTVAAGPAFASGRQIFVRLTKLLPRGMSGRVGLILGSVVVATIAWGSLRGVGANVVHITQTDLIPSWAHPFGTDGYGRDELARFAAGGRTSLYASLLVITISMTVAVVVGGCCGMIGGALDAGVMRFVDVLLSIPGIVLAMAVIGALGPGFVNLVGALCVSYSASFTRMARAFALQVRTSGYLASALLAGIGRARSILTHVVPTVFSRLTVVAALTFGEVIISIAGLSFLGLGVQPPQAEWGSMLSDSQSAFSVAPWLLLAPGLGIVFTALAVNLIIDELRER